MIFSTGLPGRLRYTTAVRADSIRDRYAKGMALLGLGLLAGTGALVDYWPTRGHVPLVASPERGDLVRLASTSHHNPLTIVVPPPAATRRAPRARLPEPAPMLLVGAVPRVGGVPVALVAPVAPVTDPIAEPVALLASAAPVTTVGASLILPPLATPRHTASWSTDSDDGGFLTGAVKRTGASILRTSARAGASVFDAFRSLGGAVKRVLPD